MHEPLLAVVIERFKYREWTTKFDDACRWIETLGVKLDRTRAAEYRESLSEIVSSYEAGEIEDLRGRRGDLQLLNTLTEVGEFIHIHSGLEGLRGEGLVARLNKFCVGRALKSDETSQRSAPRNFGFELSMASLFRNAGLPVDLENHPDIFIATRPFAFNVECKRPSSRRQVEKRIRDGLNQLEKAYTRQARPSAALGILAVDISRLENDGTFVLQSSNERELRDDAAQSSIDFIKENERHWNAGTDPRTLAVLVHVSGPAYLREPSLLTVISHTTFACIHPPGSAERKQLDLIARPVDSYAKNRNPIGK